MLPFFPLKTLVMENLFHSMYICMTCLVNFIVVLLDNLSLKFVIFIFCCVILLMQVIVISGIGIGKCYTICSSLSLICIVLLG